MNNSITKDTVIDSGQSVRVFDNDGVKYRAESISAYTPITFRDLIANTNNLFSLGDEFKHVYEILGIELNLQLNHLEPTKNIIDNKSDFTTKLAITTLKKDVVNNQAWFLVSNGHMAYKSFFLVPGEKLSLRCDQDLKSVTFWCKPCFLEAEVIPHKLEV